MTASPSQTPKQRSSASTRVTPSATEMLDFDPCTLCFNCSSHCFECFPNNARLREAARFHPEGQQSGYRVRSGIGDASRHTTQMPTMSSGFALRAIPAMQAMANVKIIKMSAGAARRRHRLPSAQRRTTRRSSTRPRGRPLASGRRRRARVRGGGRRAGGRGRGPGRRPRAPWPGRGGGGAGGTSRRGRGPGGTRAPWSRSRSSGRTRPGQLGREARREAAGGAVSR